jgi:hypothetical protein
MTVAPAERPGAGSSTRPSFPVVPVRLVVRESVVVGLVAMVVALAMTWPLVLSPNDRAHDPYDPLFQAWSLDWVQHALGGADTIADGNIFAPNVRTHAYADSLFSLGVVLLPFRWAGMSPIGLINVTIFGGFAATAAAGYAFARVVTARRLIGVCCATVFAFGPYNTQLTQHANLVAHGGPAIAGAAVWRFVDRWGEGGRTWPSLAVLAATVALNATTSFYLGALTVVAALVVLAVRWRPLGWRGAAAAAAAMAVGGLAALPIAWPYPQNAVEVEGFRWDLDDFGFNAAQFGMVDPSLTLWGGLLGSPRALFTQATFPGVTVIALTLAGVVRWISLVRSRRRPPLATALGAAVALLVVGFVLSLGTDAHGWRQFTPYRVLYELVPGFAALRASGRFWLIGLLGCGVLAGAAVQWLVDRIAVRMRRPAIPVVAGVVVAGLVLAEGYRPWDDSVEAAPAAVDWFLADLDRPGGVVYVPMPSPDEGLGMLAQARVTYRTTAHHRRTPNGFGGFTPDSYGEIQEVVTRLPDAAAVAVLQRIGVRFVVVGRESSTLRNPATASPLRFIGDFDGDLLYELP